jgi:glycine cleavage system H protein
MNIPADLKYTKEHEWALVEGGTVTIGITDHAQSALGDIVYCELPKVGRELKAGETFGVVESIKAVSDLYAPLSGKVIAINSSVVDNPGAINVDPYRGSWMIKVELKNKDELQSLLDSSKYEELVRNQK